MTRFRPLLLPGSWALTIAFSAIVAADEVVLIPNATYKAAGGRVRGQITSESPVELKIQPPTGAEQTIPVDQIDTISYDGAPASFVLAETREKNGQLTEAADLYKKAAAEATAKPLVMQAARFRRAAILTDTAFASPPRAKEAIDELTALVQSYPTSRYSATAMDALIRLQLQQNDTAKARATLDAFKNRVPGAANRAAILATRILIKEGKADDAIAQLDTIIAAGKGTPQAREAQLAKAESLVILKKYDDAITAVQQVIQESPPEAVEIQAIAHNTLGDCYRAARRPKDALLAYLKTDILYDKDKEQHPKALAMIEQLFRELKVDVRADEVHERLKQLYPQSPYLAAIKN